MLIAGLTPILSVLLRLAGLSLVTLALGHFVLPKLLGWPEDLAKLRAINRQIFYVHTAFLVVGIFLFGLVCLLTPDILLSRTPLGLVGSGCFFLCWLSRLICQVVIFTSDITTDLRIDKWMRISGTLLWIFYNIVFGALFAYQCGALGEPVK